MLFLKPILCFFFFVVIYNSLILFLSIPLFCHGINFFILIYTFCLWKYFTTVAQTAFLVMWLFISCVVIWIFFFTNCARIPPCVFIIGLLFRINSIFSLIKKGIKYISAKDIFRPVTILLNSTERIKDIAKCWQYLLIFLDISIHLQKSKSCDWINF